MGADPAGGERDDGLFAVALDQGRGLVGPLGLLLLLVVLLVGLDRVDDLLGPRVERRDAGRATERTLRLVGDPPHLLGSVPLLTVETE